MIHSLDTTPVAICSLVGSANFARLPTVVKIDAQKASLIATITIARVCCRAERDDERESDENGGRLHVVGGSRSEFALSAIKCAQMSVLRARDYRLKPTNERRKIRAERLFLF